MQLRTFAVEEEIAAERVVIRCGKTVAVVVAIENREIIVVLFDGLSHLVAGNTALIQELNTSRLDLDRRARRTVVTLPCSALKLTFDEHGAPLTKLVRAALCKPVPGDHADVADILLPLVIAVAEFPVRGDREI